MTADERDPASLIANAVAIVANAVCQVRAAPDDDAAKQYYRDAIASLTKTIGIALEDK